jgi:hypothetical protein
LGNVGNINNRDTTSLVKFLKNLLKAYELHVLNLL